MIDDFHKNAGYTGKINISKETIHLYLPENKIIDRQEKFISYSYKNNRITKVKLGNKYYSSCPESIFRLCVLCDIIYECKASNFPLSLATLEYGDGVQEIDDDNFKNLSKHGSDEIESIVKKIDIIANKEGKEKAVEYAHQQGIEEEYKILLNILHYGIN